MSKELEERMKLALELVDQKQLKEDDEKASRTDADSVTAEQIIELVSSQVVGQERAVAEIADYISLWFSWHRKVTRYPSRRSKLPAMKGLNITGATASGKTFVVRTIFKQLGVDFNLVNAASLTGCGWKGQSVTTVFDKIARFQASNPDAVSVVFFDEIDKHRVTDERDPVSFNPMTDMLAPLDSDGSYTYRSGDDSDELTLNTDNIIWIFAGAYQGIEHIVKKRLQTQGKGSYGLLANDSALAVREMNTASLRKLIEPIDLVEFGMPSELIGRAGYMVNFETLTKEQLMDIVNNSPNSLKSRYGKILPKNVELVIEDSAAEHLAVLALSSGLGARALESNLLPVVGRANTESASTIKPCLATIEYDEDAGTLKSRISPRKRRQENEAL